MSHTLQYWAMPFKLPDKGNNLRIFPSYTNYVVLK